MTDGPRPGATETFARTRTECSERPLPEPSSRDVQQRSLSRRGRTALAITGVALASLLMAVSVGCGTKVEAPASPGTEQQSLSAEAQKFVAEFGSRYSDPVSTYYAEKAYEKNVSIGGVVIPDEYINNFNSNDEQTADGNSDTLQFTKYELLLNKQIDQKAFVDVFNSYIAGGMSEYMNLMSKNPTPEAVKVIKSEFLKFYSDARDDNMPAHNTPAKPEVINLMDTLDGVVEKYGSTANYSVAQASAYDYTDSQEGTIFTSLAVDSGHVEYGGQNVEYFFTSGVDIAINVEVFKGDKSTRVTETLKDTELTLWRQPFVSGKGAERNTDISIGQRKIAE